jgi:Do/DeqQ family serine protease
LQPRTENEVRSTNRRNPIMHTKLTLPLVLVLSGFVAGLVVTGRMRTAEESAARQVAERAAPARNAAAPIAGLPDFTGVVSKAVDGVVNISAEQIVRTRSSPFFNDPFFEFFGGGSDMYGRQSRRALSRGSGVLISADGYVVTNNHVVAENDGIVNLTLGDKREVAGRVIGTDPDTDLALVKVDVKGAPVVPWGDSSKLKVGEWVLAIGSPYQLDQTVTLGIVSALGRANMGFAAYEDFIQTDAAINPGNSGGALINARGELIGINTGIFSQSGGYQGIGFAIPSNLAQRIIAELKATGRVRRASIGYVELSPLTTQLVEELGVPNTHGALVNQMARNSPAYRAGLQPGDVIVSLNGRQVDDGAQFVRMLLDTPIGGTVTIGVIRNGRRMDIKVPVVEQRGSR